MEIFGIQADGSQVTRLTKTDFGRSWNPAWSPDCSEIAYEADMTGDMLVYVMDLEGGPPTAPMLDPERFYVGTYPSWSPDGQKIAFSGRMEGDSTDTIFVMNADGTEPVRLTQQHPPGLDYCPSWSPDGKYLAFINTPTGADDILTIMEPDGSNARELFTFDHPGYGCPSWSPDSRRMTIVIPGVKDAGDIAIIDTDGNGLVNLNNSEDQDWDPAWSPDGQRIAFISQPPGEDFDAYSMGTDGSDVAALTDNTVNDHMPAWCPLP